MFFYDWFIQHEGSNWNSYSEPAAQTCREVASSNGTEALRFHVNDLIVPKLLLLNWSTLPYVTGTYLQTQKFFMQAGIYFTQQDWEEIIQHSLYRSILDLMADQYGVVFKEVNKFSISHCFDHYLVAGIHMQGDVRVFPAFYWIVKFLRYLHTVRYSGANKIIDLLVHDSAYTKNYEHTFIDKKEIRPEYMIMLDWGPLNCFEHVKKIPVLSKAELEVINSKDMEELWK